LQFLRIVGKEWQSYESEYLNYFCSNPTGPSACFTFSAANLPCLGKVAPNCRAVVKDNLNVTIRMYEFESFFYLVLNKAVQRTI
jgi:hypothetical protein